MTRALPETTSGTTSEGSAGGTASKDTGGVRIGDAESAVNHPSSSAFEAWLAGYRSRLEELVKNGLLK